MRLTSGMSEAEIRAELEEEALRTWGAQRLEALQAGMTDAARHIRALLELQAGPLDEVPDFAGTAHNRPEED